MSPTSTDKLTLTRFNEVVYTVHTAKGVHVGNLKWVRSVWKFKAIGYDEDGSVVPGGGPFTHQHNASFGEPDAAALNAALQGRND